MVAHAASGRAGRCAIGMVRPEVVSIGACGQASTERHRRAKLWIQRAQASRLRGVDQVEWEGHLVSPGVPRWG